MSNQNEQILEAMQTEILADWTLNQYIKTAQIVLSPADIPNVGQDTPFVLITPQSDTYAPMGIGCAASEVVFTASVTYFEEYWAEDAGTVGNSAVSGVMKGQRDLIRLLNRNTFDNLCLRTFYRGGSFGTAGAQGQQNIHTVTLTFEMFYIDEGV